METTERRQVHERLARGCVCTGLVLGVMVGAPPGRAQVDAAAPPTVSADGLPTVQIDGVVWSSVVVGDTAYATGSFGRARPAGAAAGTSETTRNNLLAFRVSTGALITSFNHSLNGAGRAITVSPDGSVVYVGGDFTTVDGLPRGHLAAFDVSSGALLTNFTPTVSGQVAAIEARGDTVFVGGTFSRAGGAARTNVAAFRAYDGALRTSWAPTVDAAVTALTTSPDGTRVIVGGRFLTLNGVTRRGLGAVDAATGGSVSWSNPPFFDYGLNSAFTSLTHDDQNVYGTGYNFGGNGGEGNFEGRFAIKPDGAVVWIDDCHGDSYSIFVTGQVAYSAGHSHNCATQGAFPETNPRSWRRALASTIVPLRTIARNLQAGYANFSGRPAPDQLNWYPAMSSGTYTGAYQGPWSVSGNQDYVVMGGEFPKVNGKGQQGLVRYAVRSIAPNKVAPVLSPAVTPAASTSGLSSVRLRWTATYDLDDATLTYSVYRDAETSPIGVVTGVSRFWSLPALTFVDTRAATGRHTYRVRAADPYGNVVTSGVSNAVTVVAGTAARVQPATAPATTDVSAPAGQR